MVLHMIDFKKYLSEQTWNIPSNRIGITSGDYGFARNITGPVSGFNKPDGMAAMGTDPDDLRHPDPTVRHRSIDDVIRNDLYDALKQEWALYGEKGLYLNGSTAASLAAFQSTPSYLDLFERGETRWGVRPPIINWLADGVEDSYHKTGQAVDLKLNVGQGSINPNQLIDCVWNALYSGFRGIGFGGQQFHFDTRNGGLLGYTYDKWRSSSGPADALQAAFYGLAQKAKERGSTSDQEYYLEAASRVNTSLRVLPENSAGKSRGKFQFSESDIRKYITRPMDAERDSIAQAAQSVTSGTEYTPQTQSTERLSFTDSSEPSTTSQSSGDTPYLLTKGGRQDLVTLGILGAVILGGFYGFRAFFRHIRNRSERARYEKEIRRLLSQKSRRELIGEFRMKHARAIVRAKRDPRLARELEFKLAKILANNGYPIY